MGSTYAKDMAKRSSRRYLQQSLIRCYDASLGPSPDNYLHGALQCCGSSSFAAGDQDLGGIGVSIQILDRLALSNRAVGPQILTALAFEAFFTSLILIEAIWDTPEATHRFHLPSAIKGTIETFLDTAIFFSLSVFIAAVAAIGHFAEEGYYEPILLCSVFNFTVGPLVVVVSLHFTQLRRRKFRIGIVVTLVLLSFALVCVAVSSSSPNLSSFANWAAICCPELSGPGTGMSSTFAIANLSLTAFLLHQFTTPTLFYFLNLVFRPELWKKISEGNTFLNSIRSLQSERRKSRRDRRKKRSAYSRCLFELYHLIIPDDQPFGWRLAIYSFVFAWSQLGFIFYQRFKLGSCAKGEVYKENQFGFGQTLAALMWLPVLADFGDILFCKS